MDSDHDDPDGWLVWPEIETAVTLQEMIISTGASVPVFYWRSNFQYPKCLPLAGTMLLLGFLPNAVTYPRGPPLSIEESLDNQGYGSALTSSTFWGSSHAKEPHPPLYPTRLPR